MTTSDRRAPLSSLSVVPLTDETRERLLGFGVTEKSLQGLTEMGGQSLLALHGDAGEEDAPTCFRSEYDPGSRLCAGCLYQPACWRGDLSYLHRVVDGESDPPPGVPQALIDDRTAYADKRRPKPPPRKKKGIAMASVAETWTACTIIVGNRKMTGFVDPEDPGEIATEEQRDSLIENWDARAQDVPELDVPWCKVVLDDGHGFRVMPCNWIYAGGGAQWVPPKATAASPPRRSPPPPPKKKIPPPPPKR